MSEFEVGQWWKSCGGRLHYIFGVIPKHLCDSSRVLYPVYAINDNQFISKHRRDGAYDSISNVHDLVEKMSPDCKSFDYKDGQTAKQLQSWKTRSQG